MTIETTKESMCINRLIGQKNEIRTIEEASIVPDIKPDILSIIRCDGNIFIYKKEILEDKIRIDGTIQTYMIYLADDSESSTRSIYCNVDFSETIPFDGAIPGMTLYAKECIDSLEARVINGRKVNIKANLTFDLKLYSNENIDVICEINGDKDIQKLISEMEINTLIGEGSTKAIAKETINIDLEDNFGEILSVDVKLLNKDNKISYNKVLAKTDCKIKILYLTEDNHIKNVENIIPVMGFIDIQNVSENHLCDTNYELKNLIIKPSGEGEHSLYTEIELEVKCLVFEKKRITYIQDLYSPIKNISFDEKKIRTINEKQTKEDIYSINENVSFTGLNGNEIYNIKVMPTILSKKIQNDKIMYDGEVKLNILYGNENRLDAKEVIFPLENTLEIMEINNTSDVDTKIEVIKQDVKVIGDGQVNISIDIKLIADVSSFSNIFIIENISENDETREDNYSMIIYLTKPGDTVWKIAKRFGSTVEDIARINDLENPDILQKRNKALYTTIYQKHIASLIESKELEFCNILKKY